MPRRAPVDPYLAVIKRFNQRNVRYVVVGMSGINFYATSPAFSFGTMDYDCLLAPTLENVRRAVDVLQRLGFTVSTSEGAVTPASLRQAVREQRTLIASTVDGILVELLLRVSGYTFAALAEDAKVFAAQGVPVQVGQIEKLLHSKRVAGRPKDKQFLARYAAQLAEQMEQRDTRQDVRIAKRRR